MGDEKKDVSRVEDVIRRFEELLKRAGTMRQETAKLVRLIAGEYEGQDVVAEAARKVPTNVLDVLRDLGQNLGEELVGIDHNLDHLKEQVATGRFDNPAPVDKG